MHLTKKKSACSGTLDQALDLLYLYCKLLKLGRHLSGSKQRAFALLQNLIHADTLSEESSASLC